VEGKVAFQSNTIHTPDIIKSTGEKGEYQVLGQGKSAPEVTPAVVEDAITGEQIPIFGETTILTEFDNMKSVLEASVPNLSYVHDKIESGTYPEGGQRRSYKDYQTSQDSPVIQLTNDMSLEDIDPDAKYSWGKQVLTGSEIIKKAKEGK
jgi:hypothetical protein